MHRALGAQGDGDAVGADALLGPLGAGDEADPVGAAAQAPFALLPEHVALGVGDGEDQREGVGRFQQGLAQHRHDRVESAGAAALLDLARAQQCGGGAGVGVQAEAAQPGPGVADLGTGFEQAGGAGLGGGRGPGELPGGGVGEGALMDLGQFRRGRRGAALWSSGLPSGLPHSVCSSPPFEVVASGSTR